MEGTSNQHLSQHLSSFLRARMEPDVIARLEVCTVGAIDVAQLAAAASNAPTSDDGILRPIPKELFKPPRDVRIMQWGTNVSELKGDYIFNEESVELVRAFAASWGNDYSADYEHAAFTNGEAPAACWYGLDARPGEGLFAKNVRWTEKAAEYLRTWEYRYLSGAFIRHPETKVVLVYFNFALTNIPATHRMPPFISEALAQASARPVQVPVLATVTPVPAAEAVPVPAPAASAAAIPPRPSKERYTMDYILAQLGLTAGSTPEQTQGRITEKLTSLLGVSTALMTALGLSPATGTLDQALAEVKTLKDSRTSILNTLGLASTATVEQMSGGINQIRTNATGLSAEAERLGGLRSRLVTLTGVAQEAELENSVKTLVSLQEQVKGLTGKATLQEQVVSLTAFKENAERASTFSAEVKTLNEKVTQLEDEKRTVAHASLIDTAIAEGRLTPASRASAERMAALGTDALTSFLSLLPTHPAGRPSATPPNNGAPANTGNEVVVTTSMLEMGRRAGQTAEQVTKAAQEAFAAKQAERAARASTPAV